MTAHRSIDTVAVVIAGGPLHPTAVQALAGADRVVAADGGLDHALAAGLEPDVLVGDLDSVSDEGLHWAKAHIRVEAHPADKAATDTELALAHAAAMEPRRLVLVAGRGDRLDHALAALGALGASSLAGIPDVRGWWGDDEIQIAHPGRPVLVARPPGTTFSALALHGPCHGVTITGSRWPLVDAELAPVVGLGVSNEVVTPPVRVEVAAGVVTVIIPHVLGTAQARGAQP